MRCILLALALLATAMPAAARDSWISRGGFRSPVSNEWCCGDVDCRVIDPERVREIPGGLAFRLYSDLAGNEKTETVPWSEVLPSMDSQYWRCQRADGSRRCAFAPPRGS